MAFHQQNPDHPSGDPTPLEDNPNDSSWHDAEVNDDDMDFLPAESESVDDYEHEFNHDSIELLGDFTRGGMAFDHSDGEDEEESDESEGDEDQEEEDEDRPVYLTREQILQFLGRTGLGRLFTQDYRPGASRRLIPAHENVPDEDEEEERRRQLQHYRQEYRRLRFPNAVGPYGRAAFQPVPNPMGRELMEGGDFGSCPRSEDSFKRSKKLACNLMKRELGIGSNGRQKNASRLLKQNMIPESVADTIIHYDKRCYSGQFSDDGNFFFSCSQDYQVRMYDTSNPYDWKYYKSVLHPRGQWTITDASLSSDNRFLAYSSITSTVCLAPTDPDNHSDPNLLNFANMGGTPTPRSFSSHFGIWSLRFSGDGREIVAGTDDNSVYVYDIERRQTILRIPGHKHHVNAVCFGDSQSPHIIYSGSDDTTLKVWDRRSMSDGREAGVFLGHTEGLTYVDTKGDGRYVLSNGKDQTAKLWDLRKMSSKETADGIDSDAYTSGFEYRCDIYNDDDYEPHPHDSSVVTFRGHKVLKTLIRCHFSPPGSTDSRYVYSGSYDGSVYIWNLDATLAGKVDVLQATKNTRPRVSGPPIHTFEYCDRAGWMTCVRDASWHPYAPLIAATSWNGWGTAQGTCTVHSWNDGVEDDEAEPAVGRRVDEKLRHDDEFYRPLEGRRSRRNPLWYNEMMED